MNEKLLVKCEKLDHYGRGLVRSNGKIIFVPGLLPDEEAYIEIILVKKKFMIGKILEIVKESNDRIDSKCPYSDCGCALRCFNYEKTLQYKEGKVKEILKKFAGIDNVVLKVVPSDIIYGYRNKITLKIKNGVGYYKNGSNDFIGIDKCLLASDRINEIISVLNNEDLSLVKEIVIKDFEQAMIVIDGKMNIDNLKKYAKSIYMNDKLVYGDEFVLTQIKDLKFLVSKDSFFQVNSNVVEKLYEKVLECLPKDNNKSVLDLYCGTGTITLFLGKYFKNVVGIEINKEAIRCANENKKLNKVDNVKFICGDVSKEIHGLKADYVVVDPPRAGLNKKAISDILKINPEVLVYVSCDPVTLARDLSLLKDNYNIISVTPFDMFPFTYHVENVTLLMRRENI